MSCYIVPGYNGTEIYSIAFYDTVQLWQNAEKYIHLFKF